MDFSSIINSIKDDLKGFDLLGETSLIIQKGDVEKDYKVVMATLTAEENVLIPEMVSALGENVTSFTQMGKYRKLTVLFAIRSMGPLDLTAQKFVKISEDAEGQDVLVERYKVFEDLLQGVPDYVFLDLWNFYTSLVEKQKERCKVVTKEDKQKIPTLDNKKLEQAMKVEGEKPVSVVTPTDTLVGRDLTPEEAQELKRQLDNKVVLDTRTDEISDGIRDKKIELESVKH